MKNKLYDILQKTGVLFLLNVAVILVYLVMALFIKIPVVNELLNRFADPVVLSIALLLVYCIAYYVILALAIFKNASAKRAFLNATAESGYTLRDGALDYFKNYFMSDTLAVATVSVIAYALLGMLDIGFVKLLFLPQLALFGFFSNGACVVYLVLTLALNFVLTLAAQYIWDKNRLGSRKDAN